MKSSTALSLVAGACLVAAAPADAEEKTSPWRLSLGCTLQTSKATVTNTRPARIAGGTRVAVKYIQRRTGDFGIPYYVWVTSEYSLPSTLAPGGSFVVSLPNAQAPICSASFDPGPPDLRIEQVTKGNGFVDVVLKNGNDFFDVPQTVLKVAYMKCPQVPLAQAFAPVPVMLRGTARTVRVARPFPAGFQYLVVVADATNLVHEANESNNVFSEVGVCLH